MHLPYLRSRKQKTEKQIVAFRGVNYGEAVRDGDLSESQNLTAERFPCMSPRAGRTVEGDYDSATAVYYKNGQFVVNGTSLLYQGEQIAMVTPGKKQFVSVNTKVVIFPDSLMFDTATGDVRKLGADYLAEAGFLEIVDDKTMVFHQGRYYSQVISTGNIGGTGTTSENKPTLRYYDRFVKYSSANVDNETGKFTLNGKEEVFIGDERTGSINISEGTIFTKMYLWNSNKVLIDLDPTRQYAVITKVYRYRHGPGALVTEMYFGYDYEIRAVKGSTLDAFPGFEALGFRAGDTVEIEGMTTFADYNGSRTIRAFGTHGDNKLPAIIFDAESFSKTGTEEGAVSIRRKTPALTIACESNNRLWGAEGNTIYASALGDPTNFFTYDGLDTDSYAVAVASEGAFTGCCGFGNSVLFWKEDKLHKILGAYPSQYIMYEYNVPGVKLGSEQSLCNINEVVYYHGREGVYRYNGGSPELISENFGLRRYEEAAAGAIEGRYYLSMKDRQKGEWGLWVYDTLKNIWLREDDTHAMGFAANEGKLYCIGGSKLMCLNPDDSGEVFAWSATTARMDEMFHNRKCYSKLLLRGELLEDSAWLQVDISCDGEPFKRVYTSRDKSAKTLAIPIMPKRCDSFRIRLSGEGKFIIRSLVREFGIGSEY